MLCFPSVRLELKHTESEHQIMPIFDTHVHTTFSTDGRSTLDDYAAAVRGGQIRGIGLTDHVDVLPGGGSYGHFDPADYLQAIHAYQEQGCPFWAGAEIDYASRGEAKILDNLQRYRYAYTIGSVHLSFPKSTDNQAELGQADSIGKQRVLDMIRFYYAEVKAMLARPEFDVIGHAGVYKRYLKPVFLKDAQLAREISGLDHELARVCAQSGKILEINTSGLFAPLGKTIPDITFTSEYCRCGGRLVSIGSDAHQAAHLGRGFATAYALLREIGFQYLTLPWDKDHPLPLDSLL